MAISTQERLRRWERWTEAPLTLGAVVYLLVWSIPIIDPTLPRWVLIVCAVLSWVTWAMVAVDYVVRVMISPDRWRFVRQNPFSLLVVLFPMLRPLRLLELLTSLNRRASAKLRGKVTTYAVGGSVLLAYCGALLVLEAERTDSEATIRTLGDALWWAVTTMTTVGYGDLSPVTQEGKFVAAALMIAGIALLGAVTATLASWLLDHVSAGERDQTAELLTELRTLRDEVAALREALAVTDARGQGEPETDG